MPDTEVAVLVDEAPAWVSCARAGRCASSSSKCDLLQHSVSRHVTACLRAVQEMHACLGRKSLFQFGPCAHSLVVRRSRVRSRSALFYFCAGRHLPVPHSRSPCQQAQHPTTCAAAAWHWGRLQPHHSVASCPVMGAGPHPLKAALMMTREISAKMWSQPLLRTQARGQRSDAKWPSGSTILAPGFYPKVPERIRPSLCFTKRAWTTSRAGG